MANQLSDDQSSEFKETFDFFDKDGDDYITTEDLATTLRSLGLNPTHDEVVDMINGADADGDGAIDFPNFLNMMMTQNLEDDEERLKYSFRVFDMDQDGFISTADLRQILTNLGENLTDEEVNEMLREADVEDGDGLISYDEFVKVMKASEDQSQPKQKQNL